MSWRESEDWDADEIEGSDGAPSWPLDPRSLYPRERWVWYERLWTDVIALQARYQLGVRSEWWAKQVQVEVLSAFAAWIELYDSGSWDDPSGKLLALYDLERVNAMLADGRAPFVAADERTAFLAYLAAIGCRRPESP